MKIFSFLKYILLFAFIPAGSIPASANINIEHLNYIVDSLKNVLATQTLTEKQKLAIYNGITCNYAAYAVDSVLVYAPQTIQLAQKLGNVEIEMLNYSNLGVAYCFRNKYDTALFYLNKLKELAEKTGNIQWKGTSLTYTALVFSRQGKYITAIDYLTKSLAVRDNNKRIETNYITALINLAELYRKLNDPKTALQYLNRADELCNKSISDTGQYQWKITQIYNEYAFNYLEQGNLDKALKYASMADKNNIIIEKCDTKRILATIYLRQNNPEKALQSATAAMKQAGILNDTTLYVDVWMIFSDIYLAKKRYPEAETEALKAWQADSSNIDKARTTALNIVLANIYMSNTEKAAYYLKKYSEMNAQYSEKSFQTTVSDLTIKYETEKKDIAIKELEKERRLYMLMMAVCIITILLILYLLNVKQRLNRQKIKQFEQEKQLIVSQAIIDGEAAERKRIARDLHDGLGGMLSVVKLNLSEMKEHSLIKNADAENLNHAVEMLDKSIAELRRVSHHIMPDLSGGLKPSLEDFCRSIPGIDFRFIGDDSHLDNHLKITVYRCVYELINNAIKHSHAKAIHVQLMIDEKFISLSVQDDGTGFVPEKATDGSGLENIRARLAAYNGKMNIYSSPEGSGTEVSVEIEL